MRIAGPTLKALRELSGLSQAELGRVSGVSQGHISDLEASDLSDVRPATAKRLAGGMGIPVVALAQIEAVAS